MNIYILAATASSNEFTGFEHSRIVDLLTVLAFISIAMWTVVCISFVIRQSAIMAIQFKRFMRNHPIPLLKYLGKNNGS